MLNGCGSKNKVPNGTLVSGNMDQNLRSLLFDFEPHPHATSGTVSRQDCVVIMGSAGDIDEDLLLESGDGSPEKAIAVVKMLILKIGCPGKWNQGLKPAVPWWFYLDPDPLCFAFRFLGIWHCSVPKHVTG